MCDLAVVHNFRPNGRGGDSSVARLIVKDVEAYLVARDRGDRAITDLPPGDLPDIAVADVIRARGRQEARYWRAKGKAFEPYAKAAEKSAEKFAAALS